MSDQNPPQVIVKNSVGISAVWLIPTIALIFGMWLIVKAVAERGTFITIQFDNASGIVVGKTQVRYKGLPAGIVTDLDVSEDLQHVIVEVEMSSSTKSILTENTLFWYVTADVSIQGITGLDTLLSGGYINVQPDFDGNDISQRHFIALKEAPALDETTPGLHIILQAENLSSISKNSPVSYKKITVGHVSGYQYNDKTQQVDINVFIQPQYAHLVKENSRFWNASGFDISGSLTSSVKIKTDSLAAIIAGGIAFDDAKFEPELAVAHNGQKYPLFPDFQSAEMGHAIELVLPWHAGIDRGASIIFQGLTLGVIDAFEKIDPQHRKIIAKAKINPRITPYLTAKTQFFVVSPSLDLAGATNMSSVLKGTYISFRPSTIGEPKTSFQVFKQQPAYNYDEPGRHLVLTASHIDSINIGSAIYYQQQIVGAVQAIESNFSTVKSSANQGVDVNNMQEVNKHDKDKSYLVHVFIEEKYMHLVKRDSHFWNVSGIKISGNLQGFELQAQSLKTVLAGGIAFDSPNDSNEPIVSNGDEFILFTDEKTAAQRTTFTLLTHFTKRLNIGTRVMYQGEEIGSVHDINRHGEQVNLQVGVLPEFSFLLKEQSQFWLAKPILSLAGLSDSEAIFGGSYIGVNAGAGEQKTVFMLADSTPKKPLTASGLQLTLSTEEGNIVSAGSPISYKGLLVGQVDNVSLDEKGQKALMHVTIDEPHQHLVTHFSRFYNASGVSIAGSLSRLTVKTESVDTLLRGGISFYNPEYPHEPQESQEPQALAEGEHFTLFASHAEAEMAGLAIKIRFNDIDGLHENLQVKYYDQQVGVISRLSFDGNRYGATAYVLLNELGKKFAVEGTQFWLAKTELALVGSRHVSSILDGGFIGVLPSNSNQYSYSQAKEKSAQTEHQVKTTFDARDSAPVINALPYGLNVTLVADTLGSIRQGNPVLYRQVQVGKVLGVDLASTAEKVQIYIHIAPRYVNLVSPESKFWNASGVDIEAGLFSGVDIKAESIEALLSGGIAFATPEPSKAMTANAVSQGDVFTLNDQVKNDWLLWAPKISID